MSLNFIVTNMMESYINDSLIFECVEILELDEAIQNFNQLPAQWKKNAASTYTGGTGGKDSKVEVIAATRKITSANSIITTMRKALRKDGAALVWIEMNGEPLVAVNKSDYGNEYTLLYPSGDFVTKDVRVKQHGTDKYDRRLNKYIPGKYYNRKESTLKPTEAAEKMWHVAYETLDNMNKALDEPRNSVFELAQEMKFEVRIMYPDEARLAKRKERKDAKAGIDSATMKNRKVAIERVVKNKITSVVDRIKAEVDNQVNNAIEGNDFNFKEIEKELNKINAISSRLQRILKSDNVRLKKSWSDKAELEYDLRYLMDDLKDID